MRPEYGTVGMNGLTMSKLLPLVYNSLPPAIAIFDYAIADVSESCQLTNSFSLVLKGQ